MRFSRGRGRVRCFMWRGFWLSPGLASRLQRYLSICGRRIHMKARLLRRRRLLRRFPRWRAFALLLTSFEEIWLVINRPIPGSEIERLITEFVTSRTHLAALANSARGCRGLNGCRQPGGAGAVSVRRLLAYSAIAHAGYMLLGLACAFYRIPSEQGSAFGDF
jgi:hypothetical protein